VAGIWNPLVNPLIDGSGQDNVWSGWRVNPRVEELRTDYLVALDTETQQKIATEIQQIAWDEGFYYNGGEFSSVSAWNTGITDLSEGPLMLFWNIRK